VTIAWKGAGWNGADRYNVKEGEYCGGRRDGGAGAGTRGTRMGRCLFITEEYLGKRKCMKAHGENECQKKALIQ